MYIVIYGMLHSEFKTKEKAEHFASLLKHFDKVEIYKAERIARNVKTKREENTNV